ncbi:MAG: recombinase family protein [Succinivibrionaceae bacterium]|jgi:DNA invertase Pin-like site-specific DNA recombinase|nr:recombinase family protein [Succinivibrionaceae bacterium]
MNSQKIAYKRVSTVDQTTLRQLDGMTFDKVFEEKISGKTKERPQLQAMIEYIREGDHVYVHSLDRLARNLKDLLEIVNIVTDKGCTIHFVSQGFEFSKNGSNPTSKLLLQLLGSIHEFELQLIHERQREGIESAKRKGCYKTGRPVTMTDEKIATFKTLYEQGMPVARIARELRVSEATLFRLIKKQQIPKPQKQKKPHSVA